MPIVVNQNLAKELFDKYIKDIASKKGNSGIIDEVLGKGADSKDKFQVGLHLREMAIKANAASAIPEASERKRKEEEAKQEIGAYLARLKQASDAKKYFKEALEDVENFKSAILKSELNPGKVTADSLRQVARQSIDSVEIDDGLDELRAPAGKVTPFPGEFGFEVDLKVAQEVAQIAKESGKDFVFTRPPSQGNRNAVMDSVPILKREARLSEAEFRRALLGEELSETQIKAIKKASPVHSGKTRNFLEWAGYNTYKVLSQNLAPGIFSSNAAEKPLYNKYLELRDEMISKHRGYLSSEELRRYLTGLRNQRNEFATNGNVSQTDLRALDELIAETEVAVVKANTDDMNKFVETLNKINDSALSGMQGLLDEEAAMWKFRMLQLALVASPFGLMNLMGPVAGILEPIFSGNLQFGEGLAQGISNIPFFGDIADALKLTDFIELLFDKTPLLSDVTGLINEVTDCTAAQELLGAAGPGLSTSPLVLIAAASIFSIFRTNSEFEHAKNKGKVEKDSFKGLVGAFDAFRKGLSLDTVTAKMQDFFTKQLDIILKSFSARELADFIADAYKQGSNLQIFDGLKIKYKDPATGAVGSFSFSELKDRGVDFGDPQKVVELFGAAKSEEELATVNKFVNALFAYKGIKEGGDEQKLVAFKALDKGDFEAQAKRERDLFEKEKAIDYLEEKLGFEAIGNDLDAKLKYCKKQAIDHEMSKWRRKKDLVPAPSPQDPQGIPMHGLGGQQVVAAH